MRRQDSLEKTMMLGKIEGSRKERWPNMRRINSIKTAGRSLQELSGATEDRTLWTSFIHRVTRLESAHQHTRHTCGMSGRLVLISNIPICTKVLFKMHIPGVFAFLS